MDIRCCCKAYEGGQLKAARSFGATKVCKKGGTCVAEGVTVQGLLELPSLGAHITQHNGKARLEGEQPAHAGSSLDLHILHL